MKAFTKQSVLSITIRNALHSVHDRLFQYMARTGLILAAIPLVSESLDAIPEGQRDLYVEREGKFHLDVSGLEDTTGLKSALDKERKAARDAAKDIAAWKTLGKTPDEIQELLGAQRKADEEKMAGAGEWDKLKSQMVEQNTREKSELEAKLKAKDAVVEKYLIDLQATAAITELKGVSALLLPHVKAAVKVVDDHGELVTRVVDQAGNPRVNGKGEYLTIKDLVSEMRESEVFGRAFEPSGTTGSGSQGGGKPPPGKTISEASFNVLNAKQRAAKMAEGFVVV